MNGIKGKIDGLMTVNKRRFSNQVLDGTVETGLTQLVGIRFDHSNHSIGMAHHPIVQRLLWHNTEREKHQ